MSQENNIEGQIEKSRVSLKTVGIIAIWLFSVFGVYFSMKFQLNDLTERVHKLETSNSKYNLELLEYKVNEVDKKVTNINNKMDEISRLITNLN